MSPFEFVKEVTAERFVGRNDELAWVSANMSNAQSTIVVGPPRYGKTSLVHMAFLQAQKQTPDISLSVVDLFNIRSEAEFLIKTATETLRAVSQTTDDWKQNVELFFPNTLPEVLVNNKKNEVKLHFDTERLMQHADECLEFAAKYYDKYNKKIVVCIENFQNTSNFDTNKHIAKFFKHSPPSAFIVTGDRKNEMRSLFESSKAQFGRFGDILILDEIENKLWADYLVRSFSRSGRVIRKEQAEKLCQTVKNHPYYVQLQAHIAWTNTKGFVTDQTIEITESELTEYCRREFTALTNDLSNSQVNYLKAVIDGVDRFCSAESIAAYGLNSSANVSRVRGALVKKEILEFVRHKPFFIDPVYETWFRNTYMS